MKAAEAIRAAGPGEQPSMQVLRREATAPKTAANTPATDRLPVAIERVGLRHANGSQALRDLSLSIAPGERVALIGPSGAGKTTLLSVLAAAHRPTDGRVLLDGIDPWSLSTGGLRQLRRRLFLAPQHPPLPPRQRVVTAVLAGRLPGWSLQKALRSLWHPTADAAAAAEALARFSLGDKLWQRVDRLSGGERQRVSLARLMVSPASLLLVDEPLSALDPTLAEHTLAVLVDSATERGATLVCSLHQVELALARFPRIVALRDGALFYDGPPGGLSTADLAQLYLNRESELRTAAAPLESSPESSPESIRALQRPNRCF